MVGLFKKPGDKPEKEFKVGAPPPRPAPAAPGGVPAGPIPAALKEPRLMSLDAYRGAIMLLMASAGLQMAKVVKNLTEAGVGLEDSQMKFARLAAWQLEHVRWTGGVLWDMIQPAFMFMVGAALPFSYARRAARGDSYFSRLWHALVRSIVLILLGVFLSSRGEQTDWIFTNVLAQIGLGYLVVFLFVNKPWWLQTAAVVAVLGASWYAFQQHPLPTPEDYAAVNVPEKVEEEVVENGAVVKKEVDNPERQPGELAHWSKNTNFAAVEDRTILNWFPRKEPFLFNAGGYTTLNFFPSIATMLLGLMCGEWLRTPREPGVKLVRLVLIGAVCLGVGLALGYTICPIVKRIWTPSWALYSGGIVILMLAAFYAIFDVAGFRRLALPLAVVGTNSLLFYLMSQWLKPWTVRTIHTHLDEPYAKFTTWLAAQTGIEYSPKLYDGPWGPLYESLGVLFVFWLVCLWLYRQRLFVRL